MRNRFYVTPHCSGFGVDYPGAQAHFRAMRAEGGWGAVHTEYCQVHVEGDDAPWFGARICDDHDVRNLSLLCDRVHEHGALAGIQLAFLGVGHTGYGTRLSSRGVSQLVGSGGASCFAMSVAEIRDLQQHYVTAAKRARQAGFDIIQISHREAGSIGYQFLMKYWNKRSDQYGGPFENRARFSRETTELVREAVGDDCAITIGFCVDTRAHGGEDALRVEEDGIAFIEFLDDLVDLWDVQVDTWIDDAGPSRYFSQNWQRPWIEKIRPHTKKPLAGVGRFTDPDVMVAAIRSGQLDIIGAARPAISDPFLPTKIAEGRVDDIRECIGCNMCLSRWNYGGGRIICTQNATVGEEYRRGWHPEAYRQASNSSCDVLVVGAGPAGMECAMVLGKREMRRVHLVEAAEEIGGALRWIATFRGLGEWSRVITYRETQLKRLRNVEVQTKTRLDAEAIRDYGADVVVLAVGASWDATGVNPFTHRSIPGGDAKLPHVLTPEQLMVDGKPVPGDRVVVFDCDGYFMGCSVAERLALNGKDVTLVTPADQIGGYMEYTGERPHMMRELLRLGVELYPGFMLTEIQPDKATAVSVYSADHGRVWPCEAVVLVTQRRSHDGIHTELVDIFDDEGVRVFRIGDCLEPRSIADCIFDGHRLGREIDSGDPSQPLPFIREHRVLGASDDAYDRQLQDRDVTAPSSVLRAR